MFKRDLEDRLRGIFGFKKITYDAPSEAFEQDTLFVEITNCDSNARQGTINAKVTGTLISFTQNEKLTYGFFNKRIQNADVDLKKPLYFYDIDVTPANSPAKLINIVEKRTSFIFLFSSQYDPNQGELTSLELEMETA